MAKSISINQLIALSSNSAKAILIDVRSPKEYSQQHIDGAQNIPLSELSTFEIDTSCKLVTICGKGGGRSEEAAELLEKQGFEVYYLEGGLDAWFDQGI
ncbi:MAG: hypothetical protein CMP48_08560 [Rickettsiales bacterium]|nr:hypothetical protein [Rickettsiales bacterium]|tara:strand:+ start:459 stop:755 length:297 start_codon:yes stop_codon:yes gene_type:complete